MVIKILNSRVLLLHFVEVRVWHALEHEAHHAVAELRLGFVISNQIALERMDDMHL